MNEVIIQKDFEIAKELYSKVNNNKEKFLELLDNILDLNSLIPACITEYGNAYFNLFDVETLIIDEIINILDYYGIKLGRNN